MPFRLTRQTARPSLRHPLPNGSEDGAHASTTAASSLATDPTAAPLGQLTQLVVPYGRARGADISGIVWRRRSPRHTTLVMLATDAPPPSARELTLLFAADGIIAAPELLDDLKTMGFGADRLVSLPRPFELAPFLAGPLKRAADASHRIAYVGDLSANSGAADFLACASACAERLHDRQIELRWFGQGDLMGVLRAQPTPPNLVQRFADVPEGAELAAVFADCGLLVIPSVSAVGAGAISEAMAAGMVVLGSTHCVAVRGLVADRRNGWLFDPSTDGAMFAALERALQTSPQRLDEMRLAARAQIETLLTERARETVNNSNPVRRRDTPIGRLPVRA